MDRELVKVLSERQVLDRPDGSTWCLHTIKHVQFDQLEVTIETIERV